MPIIPRYNLTQTPTHVHIEVSIPHVRVSTSTLDLVIVNGTELHLYAPPTYLLKLTLPDRVVSEDAVEDSLAQCATTSVPLVTVLEEESDRNCNFSNDGAQLMNEGASKHHDVLWTKEDLPKLQYNPEKNHGTLTVILRKEEERIWQDLDLLGRLQQPTPTTSPRQDKVSQSKARNPLVQEVMYTDEDEIKVEKSNKQETSSETMQDLLSINQQNSPTYGLFQHYSNVFRDYAREGLAHEMLECPNPDEVYSKHNGETDSISEQQNRREMRLEMENEKFDTDRYINDLYLEDDGDMIFDAAMQMVPHWVAQVDTTDKGPAVSIDNVTNQLSKMSTSDNQSAYFTANESHLLATLPPLSNIPIQLTDEQQRSAFLSLIDILFAYVYDHRTTDGDPTVESSWTVMILSPSFAWLENYNPPYDTIADIIRWNIRRSMIYPYLRSYTLSIKVVADVCQIIKAGRRPIIRCLLQLHKIMEKSEAHYLFNKLYVDPLLAWVQRCEEDEVTRFGLELEDTLGCKDVLCKDSLGLGLVELEQSFLDCGDDEDDCTTSSEEDDDEVDAGYAQDSDSRGADDTTCEYTTSADED